MNKITRTAYGSALQSNLLFGLPMKWLEFTTLNELLGIEAKVYPPSTVDPRARYFAIGNRGHDFVKTAGLTALKTFQHKATDSGPFGPIPFVLRELSNDLTVAERRRYGLRRLKEHNGVMYIEYHLRRLDLTTTTTELLYKTVKDDGTVTQKPFVPTSANLHPEPQELSPVGVNTLAGDYVSAQALIPLSFSRAETAELINVANILYGDTSLAMVSELALVSGVDKDIQVSGVGNTTFTFTEVIGAQIVTHMGMFFHAESSNDGMQLVMNAGSTEPLFNIGTPVINGFGINSLTRVG